MKGASKMRGLTVEKGLLMETEVVQEQIKALLKCNVRIHFGSLVSS